MYYSVHCHLFICGSGRQRSRRIPDLAELGVEKQSLVFCSVGVSEDWFEFDKWIGSMLYRSAREGGIVSGKRWKTPIKTGRVKVRDCQWWVSFVI